MRTFSFSHAGVANGKWRIDSRYPTQAKERLEWGTHHLLLVWQKEEDRPATTQRRPNAP